ncbi:MAG: 2,4-dihydroxyhept-2-ene-1,7-dioic acid aldolase [Candidatus Latescibacteria bacterium]|nr:2,4-dihydroxyhept-2-ene-1,7-dioic acid aldolase [Candidatus Latescibacterota bacterium]
MPENRLKRLLDANEHAIGIQLRFGTPAIAELAGLAGFDWILIDTEHAPQTPITVQSQLQAAGCTATTALVRVARNDPDLIKLYLDMGAAGIVVPFINTPEEATIGAAACRYPPRGTRGWGPHRAAGYGLFEAEYTNMIDDQVLYFPIIETRESIENIEGIMAVDGVDGCIVGPVDLCISLGIPFQFEDPAYLKALSRVRDAAVQTGKPACHPLLGPIDDHENMQRQIADGVRLLLVSGDESSLRDAFKKTLQDLSFLKE